MIDKKMIENDSIIKKTLIILASKFYSLRFSQNDLFYHSKIFPNNFEKRVLIFFQSICLCNFKEIYLFGSKYKIQ